MSEPDEILTTDEVAELLKVPKATIYAWASRGQGPPYYKIGRYSRWKKSEVLAWFNEQQDEVSRFRG